MTRREKQPRPAKPYAGFPLYIHSSGQFAKRVYGKWHYFGSWADGWQAALEKYNEQRDWLYAGQAAPVQSQTLADLLDEWLGRQQHKLELGELTQSSFNEQIRVADTIAAHFGKTRPLNSITPVMLTGLRKALAKTQKGQLGPASHKRRLSIARSVFKFGRKLNPPFMIDYADELKSPSARSMRQAKQDAGHRLYMATEARALVEAATDELRPMILLGLCAAFGPHDCCTLTPQAVQGEWIEHPRPKTGVARKAWLWPELQGQVLNFSQWDRFAIARMFAASCNNASIPNHGFYSLRRTFETIATTADVSQAVIDHVMGHGSQSMAAVYRQKIFDQQLRHLGQHVRGWYLGTVSLE